MTVIELPDDVGAQLKAKAAAQGITPEAWINNKLSEDGEAPEPVPSVPAPRRHISEVIREIMRDVPPEIMAAMPKDGASQHDHYIYGLPKRED